MLSASSKTRYGKSLSNVTLRQRYEEQLGAHDLLSLNDELSLIGARLTQLLEKLEGNGVDFIALADLHQSLALYAKINDLESLDRAIKDMAIIIQQGIKEAEVWNEAYEVIEQRRKLVETQMKTLHIIGSMLSVEQFMVLVTKMVAAVSLHVEKDKMAEIYPDLNKILDMIPLNGNNQIFRVNEKQDV